MLTKTSRTDHLDKYLKSLTPIVSTGCEESEMCLKTLVSKI